MKFKVTLTVGFSDDYIHAKFIDFWLQVYTKSLF